MTPVWCMVRNGITASPPSQPLASYLSRSRTFGITVLFGQLTHPNSGTSGRTSQDDTDGYSRSMSGLIKVMIVDDSQTTREMLADFLARDPAIQVVAACSDPLAARHDFLTLEPDVLLLDVVMPHMSGLDFLEKIMTFRPLPVIIYTGRSQPELLLEAMQRGAFAVVHKPTGERGERFADVAGKLTSLIKQTGGHLNPSGTFPRMPTSGPRPLPPSPTPSRSSIADVALSRKIITIGASTGGPAAIQTLLAELPATVPPIVLAIHMPARFTRSYAQRLDQSGPLRVYEAEDGQEVLPGTVLIAPGNRHLTISGAPGHWRARLDDRPPHRYHRPSIDWLIGSVAEHAPDCALGILLTGMGSDGVDGFRQLQAAGCRTIAQDEATSLVFGMPGEAVRQQVADHVLPLERMAPAIQQWSRGTLASH